MSIRKAGLLIAVVATFSAVSLASAQTNNRQVSFLGQTSQSSFDKCDDDGVGRQSYNPRCVSKVRCDNGWGNGADCTNPGSPRGNDRERESKTTQSGTNGNGGTQSTR